MPVDRAFAGAVERFGMPRELPEALLEGFEWDAQGRIYETISGVYALFRAGRRRRRRDDGRADGRAFPRCWPAPATSAPRCS
jgi:hypothetical protein